MAIVLSDDKKQALNNAIKEYFRQEREEELGDLAAGFFLDFVLETFGPTIYNQAVKDVQARMARTVSELDVNLYQPEVLR